jgi:signal transduction histidine kinase
MAMSWLSETFQPSWCRASFERGFTTKQQGEGTGLGLAICREIVEAHGGQIELSTLPAQGTTVRISLPVAAAQPSEHAA